jgi:hypothetical protein
MDISLQFLKKYLCLNHGKGSLKWLLKNKKLELVYNMVTFMFTIMKYFLKK